MRNKLVVILVIILLGFETNAAQTLKSTQHDLPGFAVKYCNEMFGENVFIFNPQMDMNEIQALIDTLYSQQHPRISEFGQKRYALFFKPGSYKLDLKVGYYMHFIGLGALPDDVVIKGVLISKGQGNGNVTCNFWRSVENLTVAPLNGEINIWGVSQAAPMRRVHIKGDIQLHDNGWASGGFIADSKIDGTVLAGGQQQWFSRNVDLGKWEGGSWNIMFVGVPNAPADKWPANPYTVINETPLMREKPYLILDASEYKIIKPKLRKNSAGVSWSDGNLHEDALPLNDFYIAKPNTDNSETINAALLNGKNIFLSPGIYFLHHSLKITNPNTIIIGVGLPALVSGNGNPVIEISDVDGVSVCGVIIDAGKIPSETLFRVGEPNSKNSHEKNPSFLYDIFIRVGGYGEGTASNCMVINSKNVYVDHTWLWRADHGNKVGWDENTCKNGLIVNSDQVTVYGLFCEHFQEYQTLWNGNSGKVYFYQSEMPYDPPSANDFKHGSTNGYASYKVSDGVKSHKAWGIGIYCVFFKAPVIVDQAIETPVGIEKDIHHKIIFWLNGGDKGSRIKSVINGKGGFVDFTNEKTMMD